MATNNAVNITTAGIVKYDGAGTFSAITITEKALLVGGASNAITSLGPLTNGQLLIGNTGNNPTAAAISAGTGITVTNGAGTIQLDAVGGGLSWSVVVGDTTLAVNNGYGSNKAGAIAFTLPAVSAVGATLCILGMQGSWNVVQGAGQRIYLGNSASTVGAGGSISSTNAFDSVTMICLVANTLWYVKSSIGNITIV